MAIFLIFSSYYNINILYLRKKILLTHKLNNTMFYLYIGSAISAIILAFVMKDKDKEGFKQFSNEINY